MPVEVTKSTLGASLFNVLSAKLPKPAKKAKKYYKGY